MTCMNKTLSFKEAEQYLFDRIPKDNTGLFPGEIGFKRTVALMELLGNPQDVYPVIHVAGTSGKGSTSSMCSSILNAAGYKVGLNISPHVISIRERIQINNEMISESDFARIITELQPLIEEFSQGQYGAASYFDVIVAAACVYFKEQKVDAAVFEVGLGGTLDGTNVVKSDIAIITPIGLDHERILGSTIGQIAEQKAGIIKKSTFLVISSHQRPDAESVIRSTAEKQGSPTVFLDNDFLISEYRMQKTGVQFMYTPPEMLSREISDLEPRTIDVFVSMFGRHQAENAACAITAILGLKKHFPQIFPHITRKAIQNGLKSMKFPGRFEIFEFKGCKLVLDGAHNPDKIAAFAQSVSDVYPNAEKYCLFGVKQGKNVRVMLDILLPVVQRFGITQFWKETDMGNRMGEDAGIVAEHAQEAGAEILFVDGDSKRALGKMIDMVKNEAKVDSVILVTGSLFLVSEIREYVVQNS